MDFHSKIRERVNEFLDEYLFDKENEEAQEFPSLDSVISDFFKRYSSSIDYIESGEEEEDGDDIISLPEE